MNTGLYAPLLISFNENWRAQKPEFELQITDGDLANAEAHPLCGELLVLCSKRAASLPYFGDEDIIWYTLAPGSNELRQAVVALRAWILPSFGGEKPGDGFVQPGAERNGLGATILAVSVDGYFRWRCRERDFQQVAEKLTLYRALEARRPRRDRPVRSSLYELRARFAAALLVGDRGTAERTIEEIDQQQLDSAANTQFMRIRMWRHFHEFDRIRNHPNLPRLLTQALPSAVERWIRESLPSPETQPAVEAVLESIEPKPNSWHDWFSWLKSGDEVAAESFLTERQSQSVDLISPGDITRFIDALEGFFLDDGLRSRQGALLSQGLAEFLEDFVRESEFPRVGFAELYLAILRLWGALHAGISTRKEHGHVMLELASAALRSNCGISEIPEIIAHWWSARPVPAQLPFLLDAIELLDREHPDRDAPANFWVEAAELVRKDPNYLTHSERELWRRIGQRLGMDSATLQLYIPEAAPEEAVDPLQTSGLRKVAIVCMREKQARDAAQIIAQRTGAAISIVSSGRAGQETEAAVQADVILLVWMATSHAVFRALDEVPRRKLSYVQGTGAASIVRALERWLLN